MFRLSSEPYHQPKDAFSGVGAARWGGRWNGPGVSVVYTSASPSLAALERLVHTFSVRGLASLWIYSVEVDEQESLYLPDDALPPDWDRVPVPPDWHAPPLKGTQLIGNDWYARNASLLLRVPSAVVPGNTTTCSTRLILLSTCHASGRPSRFTLTNASRVWSELLRLSRVDNHPFGLRAYFAIW